MKIKKSFVLAIVLVILLGTTVASACEVSSRSLSVSAYYQKHWILWNPAFEIKRTSEVRASHKIGSDTAGHVFPNNMTLTKGSVSLVNNLSKSSFSKSWNGADQTGTVKLTSHGGKCSSCTSKAASRSVSDANWNYIN